MTIKTSDNRRANPKRRAIHARRQRGFTLIELLVVIIIIAILAAITITIQRTAVESAMRARTGATIRKIDTALIAAYEKYQYYKVDVESYFAEDNPVTPGVDEEWAACRQLINQVVSKYGIYIHYSDADCKVKARHVLRTLELRELLRLDFPTNYREVFANPTFLTDITPLNQNYRSILNRHNVTADTLSDADLLYLIVTNIDPASRGVFLERETVDTNGNGIPEFVDGWGNPIRFLRWAPSLAESHRQPVWTNPPPSYSMMATPCLEGTILTYYFLLRNALEAGELFEDFDPADRELYDTIDDYYPGLLEAGADPLDPLGLLDGWLLVPLVYSAGPDKEPGIMDSTRDSKNLSILIENPFSEGLNLGGTVPGPGGTDYSLDNITNHNME